jgi:GDPmannose 4,6-dehydratase
MQRIAYITGITGMVGSHLADYLLEKTNWKIFGLCRWNSKLNNIFHLNKYLKSHRLNLVYGDLLDENSLNKHIKDLKPDFIFHLAAHSYPTTSFISPKDCLKTNIIGTLNILEAVRLFKLKKTVIHICSSSEIFGKVKKEDIPIKENCNYHPASPYAISKVGTDLLGKYYAEAYNVNTQITRMFTHTGPRRSEFFAESTFAKQIVMIEKNIIEPVIKVGNLNSLRTICDVRDAVRAYHLVCTKKPIPGSFYNIGGSYSCSVGQILDELLSKSKLKKKNLRIVVDKKRLRPIDADLQIPDTTKFQTHTGWKAKISFEKTCEDLIKFWRQELKYTKNYFNR